MCRADKEVSLILYEIALNLRTFYLTKFFLPTTMAQLKGRDLMSDEPRLIRPPPMTAERVEAERRASRLADDHAFALITAAARRHRSLETAAPVSDPTTWKQAVDKAKQYRWAGMRSAECAASQASIIARDVIRHAVERTKGLYGGIDDFPVAFVAPEDVRKAIDQYRNAWPPVAPATINKRLVYANQIGINTEGYRSVRPARILKWWLRREDEERLIKALTRRPHREDYLHMARFIAWTTRTGFRVEESLALRLHHMSHKRDEVTVPGTKTPGSQATVSVHPAASAIAKGAVPGTNIVLPIGDRVFPLSYADLLKVWNECRRLLGVEDIPTATPKALRRSAARFLHVELGMPLDVVRDYLRHRSINTTIG